MSNKNIDTSFCMKHSHPSLKIISTPRASNNNTQDYSLKEENTVRVNPVSESKGNSEKGMVMKTTYDINEDCF